MLLARLFQRLDSASARRSERRPKARATHRKSRRRLPHFDWLEDRTLLSVSPPAGLTGWWPGDGHAEDLIGGNHAVLANGATFAPGEVDQGFTFDGVNDEGFVSSKFPFHDAGDRTLEFWIKSPAAGHQSVFWTRPDDTDSNRFNFFVNADSTFGFDYRSPNGTLHTLVGQCCTGEPIPANTWTHLAIVRSGTNYSLYKNGSLATSARDRNPDLPTSVGWQFSGRSGYIYNGNIDEVSVYSRALSASEIQVIASAGAAGKTKPMMVLSSTPAGDSFVSSAPTDFVINFTNPYNPMTVQASDLSVNNIAADSVVLIDADTATFHYTASPVASQGLQTIQMLAGAVAAADGTIAEPLLRAFSKSFRYDVVRMQVAATNPAAGDTIVLPNPLVVDFNEPYDSASIGNDDLILSRGSVTGFTLVDADTVSYTFGGLTEGNLSVSIAADAVTDPFGNPNVAYSASYGVDFGTVPFSGAFTAKDPAGSLIYQGTTSARFNSQVPPFVSTGSGGLDFPAGIAFGPDVTGDGVGELFVAGHDSDNVLRYNGATGAFIDAFVPIGGGGLDRPPGILFGPDSNGDGVPELFVSSYNTDTVMRYNGATGAAMPAAGKTGATFASGSGLDGPVGLAFSNGKLYVASEISNQVLRYDQTSGAFVNAFISAGSGGLSGAHDIAFGPDGNLYVSSQFNDRVLRFNGTTGAFMDAFVPAGSGGLSSPLGVVFGVDGNLYISSRGNNSVRRYNGSTGAFIDTFVPPGAGGLSNPEELVFGPDGALYVTSGATDQVLRFDGSSGGPGDIDNFTLDLDANQTLTVRLTSTTAATVTLSHSVLGAITLPPDQDPGPGRLYQTVRFENAGTPVAGTVTIAVQAADGLTTGTYNVELTLNALLDQSTGAPPITQSLTGSMIDVDPGPGVTNRGAALGSVEKSVPRVLQETEGVTNDLRGSWDQVGATTTWAINNSGNPNTTVNKGVTGSLNRKGSGNDASDSYRIDARAGDVLTIRTRGSSSSGGTLGNTTLTLQDPLGVQTAGSAVPGAASDQQIQSLTLTQTGSYTIIAGTGTGNKGTYTVTVDLTTGINPRFMPDDVYAFDVNSAGYISMAAATGGTAVTQPHVQLALYAPGVDPVTGTPLATSAPAGTLDAYIEFNAVTTGTYKVKLSADASTTGVQNYGLVVTTGGTFKKAGTNSAFASAQDVTGRGAVLGSCERTVSTFVAAGNGLGFPAGIAFGPDSTDDGVGELFVAGHDSDNVLRYNGATGAFINAFVPAGSGGLDRPPEILFGPDQSGDGVPELFVSSYNTNTVMRYNGASGAAMPSAGNTGAIFASGGGLSGPVGLAFRGSRLYVASEINNMVLRYDASTGSFVDTFVAAGSGGLNGAHDLVFGPDGNLYVSSQFNNRVQRYNGTTGAFIGSFVPSGSGGLSSPLGIDFGADGNLYVSSRGNNSVRRYNGSTGAFIDVIVPPGGGGLSNPEGLTFGPDGNLYVTSAIDNRVLRVTMDAAPDFYKVTLTAGQTLTVTSSTPGDGPGQFANSFDPILELYDPSFTLVASGVTLGDGRNEQVQFTAITGGVFFVKLSGFNRTRGEYVLTLMIGM